MNQPYLLYEFENEQPLFFSKPLEILQTNNLSDIPNIFKKMEQLIASGYYVAGYLSYEAAPAFEPNFKVHSDPTLPLAWFGVFDHASFINPLNVENAGFEVSDWKLASNYSTYQSGINQIKKAIEDGNIYQVNYTARLHAKLQGNDYAFYKQLTKNQQAGYSAYLNLGRYQLLSASPELFFHVKNNKIKTKPMKGTARRGRFYSEDKKILEQLQTSEKETAENLMIVDLLRNDLGTIGKPGTIQVTKLFEAETYPTVHQMTSTIEAELEKDSTVFDWFKALFPCGSITGAPKIRTMEYIAQLEQTPREVYCGAIGYITPEKEAVFNVPIRTVISDSNTGNLTYGVGSGITWDSTVTGEYEELFTKAKMLTEHKPDFKLLESLKLEQGVYPLLDYHLNRLAESSNYFDYHFDLSKCKSALSKIAQEHPIDSYKVRLLLDKSGDFDLEANPIQQLEQPLTCSLANTAVNSNDTFLYHKTTNRSVYKKHDIAKPSSAFSVLLWNEKKEVTEFTIGNLVAEKDGKFYTPPITSGLLAGTLRQKLLDEKKMEEKIIHVDKLSSFDQLWFINSIRGWLKVELR